MPTNTPNLNLIKPLVSEHYDVVVANANNDILDNAVGNVYTKSEVDTQVGLLAPKANPVFTGTQTLPSIVTNGIKFPATQVPSADPNTLDDYEEGTFTGILTATTPPTTQQTAVGYYTKKGQEVTVTIAFENKNMSGSSGILAASGLPFAIKTGTRSFGAFGSIGLVSVPTISTVFGSELRFYNSNNLEDILTASANGIFVFATITYITN